MGIDVAAQATKIPSDHSERSELRPSIVLSPRSGVFSCAGDMMNTTLIRCGDGKLAPWGIVCKHLLNGTSNEWIQLEQPEDSETFDYVCRECLEQGLDNLRTEDLSACCFHCTRQAITSRKATVISLEELEA